jgi:inorganic pyrophosphatase
VSNFFETYKKLEKDKWAKVGGWADTDATYALISKTHNHYLEQERLLEEEM